MTSIELFKSNYEHVWVFAVGLMTRAEICFPTLASGHHNSPALGEQAGTGFSITPNINKFTMNVNNNLT